MDISKRKVRFLHIQSCHWVSSTPVMSSTSVVWSFSSPFRDIRTVENGSPFFSSKEIF